MSTQSPAPDARKEPARPSGADAPFDPQRDRPAAPRATIFQLAWPSIITNVLHSIVGIVDMAIIGQVSVDAQAAVGSGHRIVFIGQAAMMAVTAGTTALVARAWGAGEREEAERVTALSIVVCSVLSLLLGAVGVLLAAPLAATFGLPPTTTARTAEFIRWLSAFHLGFTLQFVIGVGLRATGDVKTPLVIGALTNMLNVVLVYALVFGELPGVPLPIDPMDVRGAAIASGVAFTLGSILLGFLYLGGWLNLQPRFAGIVEGARLRRLWHIGYPSGLEQGVLQGGFYLFVMIVSQYGTAPNAAYNIGVQILSLSFVIGFGYSIAASTLVGQHLGAGDPERAEDAGWRSMRLSIVAMIGLGILVIASASRVAPFFNADPEVVSLTVSFIYILGLVQPLMAIEFSLSGALRGAGDTRWPLISVLSGLLGVRLTLALMFWWMGFSVLWIYGALIGDYIVKSIILTTRFARGRWKQLTI